MDLSEPIHDFLLVFLGSGLILGGLGVVLLPNPIYSAFSLGLVLVCTSLFYILSNSYFVAAASTYLRRSYKCFNHFCCDVHEWFRILQRFSSLDRRRWNYFDGLYKSFYFTNYYYFRYVMVRDYLDYKIKPDYRARFYK
nr:hypothetical protein 138 - common tobacco chloroplast [Nicotiana tabacum]prf//1211235CT ORF 138 [Nicotiana tabacum]